MICWLIEEADTFNALDACDILPKRDTVSNARSAFKGGIFSIDIKLSILNQL